MVGICLHKKKQKVRIWTGVGVPSCADIKQYKYSGTLYMLVVRTKGARLLGQTLSTRSRRLITTSMSKQGSYTYEWPRPALTVDAILITKESPSKVLLIQRKQDPFAGSWALPGGFVDEYESLHTAAARELLEETSVDISKTGQSLIQIGTFGDAGRDPRGWTVGVGYATLVDSTDLGVEAADDASAAEWYNIDELPPLAFDHKLIIKTAFERMSTEAETGATPGLQAALQQAAAKLTPPWHAS